MFATTFPERPREALSRAEAVTAYTRGSAFAEFTEKEKGHLSPGALADLAVLSKDYLTVPVGEIGDTESLLTMLGGKVVYGAGPFKSLEK